MKALCLVKLLKDSSLAMARGLMMDEMLVLTKVFLLLVSARLKKRLV